MFYFTLNLIKSDVRKLLGHLFDLFPYVFERIFRVNGKVLIKNFLAGSLYMLMDRVVVIESPVPRMSRLGLALQNPFSSLFARSLSEGRFEAVRWSIIEDFLRPPTYEIWSRDSIYAWPLEDLKKIKKWLSMLRRISGVKHSTFNTDAARVFQARENPIWILRPDLLFEE